MQMQTVPNEEKSNLFLQASVSKVAKKLTDRDKGKKENISCQCNQTSKGNKMKQNEIEGNI